MAWDALKMTPRRSPTVAPLESSQELLAAEKAQVMVEQKPEELQARVAQGAEIR